MDTINLVEGAQNPAAGLAFINYALSPEAQERFAKLMYYGPSNRNTKLPEDVMSRTSSYPATLEKMLPVDWEYVARCRTSGPTVAARGRPGPLTRDSSRRK